MASIKCMASIVLLCLANVAMAQEAVAPVTRWIATVDEQSQQILLRWSPSADTMAMGYHICTGNPCIDYDTVFGRTDTMHYCTDHSPLEEHIYRLHVFDSAYNVSALTPAFGNMVLQADVPPCSTLVSVSWSPYNGMPGGLKNYNLMVRLEPFSEEYVSFYTTDSTGPLAYSFVVPDGVTRAWLKVEAVGHTPGEGGGEVLSSLSNVVMVQRLTVDTSSHLSIDTVVYDSVNLCNRLRIDLDTAFRASPYVLWRSIDGTAWRLLDTLSFANDALPLSYTDNRINPYDSIYCYQLSVADACGLNPRYSSTACTLVPDPPPPAAAIPNVIRLNDESNGSFRPVLRGLKGDLYQLNIYSRTGLLVFSTTDQNASWTPSSHTPQGVYTYALRCRFNDNRVKTFVGTILLLK